MDEYRLTPRQRQVVQCLANGLTMKQTAHSLGVSTRNVRTITRRALIRLNAKTREHGVALALATSEIFIGENTMKKNNDDVAETSEQQARDMLERMGIRSAQQYSSGDLVELANLISSSKRIDRNKTTDIEKFIDLYGSVGIKLRPVFVAEAKMNPSLGYQMLVIKVSRSGTIGSSKVVGYSEFETHIYFDEHGNFVRQGVWE